MKVSVVIPVFNGQQFLARCLDSVLNQKFGGELEIIAVDDGSTDATPDILSRYANRCGCLTVVRQDNKGQAAARNAGIVRCSGDYVVFLDADDMLTRGSLRRMVETATNSGTKIVIGKMTRKYSADESPEHPASTNLSAEAVIERMLRQKGDDMYFGSAAGKLIHRSLFRDIRFIEGMYYEDLDIMPRLYHVSSSSTYIDFPVYFYRRNPRSFINNWTAHRLDVFRALENIGRHDFIRRDTRLVDALGDREMSAAFNMYLLMKRNGVDNPEALARCVEIIRRNRGKVALSTTARWKNRLGALLSYGGMKPLVVINRLLKLV